MSEAIIWYVVNFGCWVLFYLIGIYAGHREKPMWFWAGSEVKEEEITDVAQYNRENGRMWKLYSLWFLAAGLLNIWNSVAALIVLALSCTVGIAILVYTFLRIDKKYRVK